MIQFFVSYKDSTQFSCLFKINVENDKVERFNKKTPYWQDCSDEVKAKALVETLTNCHFKKRYKQIDQHQVDQIILNQKMLAHLS